MDRNKNIWQKNAEGEWYVPAELHKSVVDTATRTLNDLLDNRPQKYSAEWVAHVNAYAMLFYAFADDITRMLDGGDFARRAMSDITEMAATMEE
jgi:hypothetical protein